MSDESVTVAKPEDLNRDLINKLALKNPVLGVLLVTLISIILGIYNEGKKRRLWK